jgi:hypothetical protein
MIPARLAVFTAAFFAAPASAQDASRDRSEFNRSAPSSWADEVVSAIGESKSGKSGAPSGGQRGRSGGAGPPGGSFPAMGSGGGPEKGKGGANR